MELQNVWDDHQGVFPGEVEYQYYIFYSLEYPLIMNHKSISILSTIQLSNYNADIMVRSF